MTSQNNFKNKKEIDQVAKPIQSKIITNGLTEVSDTC